MSSCERSFFRLKKTRLADFLLIFLLCFFVFANSLAVGWISDDFHFIHNNPSIKSLFNAGEFFTSPRAAGYEGIYRPLRTLTFAIEYSIWGIRPFGFHLVNLLFHSASSILMFLFCMRLNVLRSSALVAALVFAAHPVQVEAVTWISSRADIIALAFMLLSFIFYMEGRRGGKRGFVALLWSSAMFVAALLSKETAIVLPVLFLAYDVFFPGEDGISVRGKLAQHIVFFGIAVLYFLVRAFVLEMVSQREYWGGSLWVTVLTMAKCFLIYLRVIFLPRSANCIEYVVPLVTFPSGISAVLPLLPVSVVVIAALLLRRFSACAAYGFAWFLVALAPVSNIFPITMLMAERFLYIPMVGICIAAAALFDVSAKSTNRLHRRLLIGILCAMILFLGLISIAKNSAWRDPVVLYTQNLRLYPESLRARMGLADTYYKRGENLEAIKHYEHALRIFPTMEAFNDLGNAYRQMGDSESAITAYKLALSLDPDSGWVLTNLGITYLMQGKTDDAIKEFQRALNIDASYPVAHFFLGVALEEKGELEAALSCYKTALAYDPGRGEARRRAAEIEKRMLGQ